MSDAAAGAPPLGLFQGYGIELEWMLVDAGSLAVLPVCDQVIRGACGACESEIEMGALAWSNELVLHVIELKTNGPAPRLEGLAAAFQADLARIQGLLEPLGGRLMPTGMHPWMDAERETRLWPHEHGAVYEAFHRIFDCRGHGWSNLQSAHLNLPFAGDGEFGRLHAAIRFLLPLMPALAASTPYVDGRATGLLDSRMEVYRHNSRRIPSVTGAVVPEPVYTRAEYEGRLLAGIYADVAPRDPEGILRHEWLNARGAIARFDRSAIEVRVLDTQECPRADLAVAALVGRSVEALAGERWCDLEALQEWAVPPLAGIFLQAIRTGEEAVVEDREYLAHLGLPESRATAGEVWHHLREQVLPGACEWAEALDCILQEGTLARRILRAVGPGPGPGRLRAVYAALCDCLAEGRLFHGLD